MFNMPVKYQDRIYTCNTYPPEWASIIQMRFEVSIPQRQETFSSYTYLSNKRPFLMYGTVAKTTQVVLHKKEAR